MSGSAGDLATFELWLQGPHGTVRTAQIVGKLIVSDHASFVRVFLTQDDRVVVYDERRLEAFVLDHPEEQLSDWLRPALYQSASTALRYDVEIYEAMGTPALERTVARLRHLLWSDVRIDHLDALLRTALFDPGDDADLDEELGTMTDDEVIAACLEAILVLFDRLAVARGTTIDEAVTAVREYLTSHH